MIKYASYANHLRFSFGSHHNKILPKDLQLKSRIKTERSKTILQRAGKLLLHINRIRINHFIRDRLKNSIEQVTSNHYIENLYSTWFKYQHHTSQKHQKLRG